jgi:hypothetical protein
VRWIALLVGVLVGTVAAACLSLFVELDRTGSERRNRLGVADRPTKP